MSWKGAVSAIRRLRRSSRSARYTVAAAGSKVGRWRRVAIPGVLGNTVCARNPLLQRVAPRENASGAHDDPEGMGDGGGRGAGRGSAGAGRSINDPDRGADLPQYPSPARLRFRKGPFDGP